MAMTPQQFGSLVGDQMGKDAGAVAPKSLPVEALKLMGKAVYHTPRSLKTLAAGGAGGYALGHNAGEASGMEQGQAAAAKNLAERLLGQPAANMKTAGPISETLGFSSPANVLGGAAALMTPTRSLEQQAKFDATDNAGRAVANAVVPGYGAYNMYKRMGSSVRSPEMKAMQAKAMQPQQAPTAAPAPAPVPAPAPQAPAGTGQGGIMGGGGPMSMSMAGKQSSLVPNAFQATAKGVQQRSDLLQELLGNLQPLSGRKGLKAVGSAFKPERYFGNYGRGLTAQHLNKMTTDAAQQLGTAGDKLDNLQALFPGKQAGAINELLSEFGGRAAQGLKTHARPMLDKAVSGVQTYGKRMMGDSTLKPLYARADLMHDMGQDLMPHAVGPASQAKSLAQDAYHNLLSGRTNAYKAINKERGAIDLTRNLTTGGAAAGTIGAVGLAARNNNKQASLTEGLVAGVPMGLAGAGAGLGAGGLYGLLSGAYEAKKGKKLKGALGGLLRGAGGGALVGGGIGAGAGFGSGFMMPNVLTPNPIMQAVHGANLAINPVGNAAKMTAGGIAGGVIGGSLANSQRKKLQDSKPTDNKKDDASESEEDTNDGAQLKSKAAALAAVLAR